MTVNKLGHDERAQGSLNVLRAGHMGHWIQFAINKRSRVWLILADNSVPSAGEDHWRAMTVNKEGAERPWTGLPCTWASNLKKMCNLSPVKHIDNDKWFRSLCQNSPKGALTQQRPRNRTHRGFSYLSAFPRLTLSLNLRQYLLQADYCACCFTKSWKWKQDWKKKPPKASNK